MSGVKLDRRSLADLHDLAAALGVPRYRLLGRAELIDEIEARGGEEAAAEAEPPGEARARPAARARGGRPAAAEDADAEDAEEEDEEEAETEPVTGILERMPQGFGFLRLEGLEETDDDVYISASQIRRCELRPGDEVGGPARAARREERHRALVRVEAVNGVDLDQAPERGQFDKLTPVSPSRRIRPPDGAEPVARAVDLLAPLAFGQRVLVRAEPRSGRTTLLRALASMLTSAGVDRLIVVLADERPEDVTAWRRAATDAEIAAAPADRPVGEQVRMAELAIARAKRRAEVGEDVAVIVDSLSRLARGYRRADRVKRLFGAGRQLEGEGAGSLTVIATVLAGEEERITDAIATTESSVIALDAELAATGVFPPLAVSECTVSGEEELREPEELEAVRSLRAELGAMDRAEAARTLAERLASTKTNEELLEASL